MTEPYADYLRRVLENGPIGPEEYEIAAWLIDQGLAAGRPGPRSKSPDHYGKMLALHWVGITPAGRLWLEQQSQAESTQRLGQASERNAAPQANGGEQYGGAPKPRPDLVKWAGTVLGGLVLALIVYLIKTHLGIPL